MQHFGRNVLGRLRRQGGGAAVELVGEQIILRNHFWGYAQNCPIFNDDAFATLKGPEGVLISLKHGEPIVFGGGEYCVIRTVEAEDQGAAIAAMLTGKDTWEADER